MTSSRFTLIELGAVVTLSGIGLGLIIQPRIPAELQPDFQAGRDQAATQIKSMQAGVRRQKAYALVNQCQNNLRQLGQGYALYATDHNGDRPGPGAKDDPGWDQALAKELGIGQAVPAVQDAGRRPAAKFSLKLFACVCDPAVGISPDPVRSYGENLGGDQEIAPDAATISMTKVKSPSGTVLLAEYHQADSIFGVKKGNYSISKGVGATADFADYQEWTKKTHGHVIKDVPEMQQPYMVLFFDGHVESLQPYRGDHEVAMLFDYKKRPQKAPIIAPPMDE
jgi:hypothetical protein